MSLIEVLTLVAFTSFTLTMMTMLTHSLLKTSREVVRESEARQVVSRLQLQLWRDSQAALNSEWKENQEAMIWSAMLSGGGRADYRVSGRTVEREFAKGQVGATEQANHRDAFRLPPSYRFVLSKDAFAEGKIEIQVERLAMDGKTADDYRPCGLRVAATAAPGKPSAEKQP